MIGWLIALGVVVLFACLPLGVSATYRAEGAAIRMIAGPVRFLVYPSKRKKTDTGHKKKEKQQKPSANQQAPAEKGGSYTDFLPLAKTVLEFLGACRPKLRVKRLDFKVILAGNDPAALAVNYGRAWAGVGNLMPHLENNFVIKKRDVEVECDFTAKSTVIYARLDLTITLGRLLHLSLRHGIRALRQFIQITNERKGGAST